MEAGDLAAAQAAVADGARVRAQNHGEEPLHIACQDGNLAIAQWLHSEGASLDAPDINGDTPLRIACIMDHLDVAQWLHGAGASVNATTNGGWTPLHDACHNAHFEMAQWLCSAGADATLKTNDGDTPAKLLQRPDRTAQLDPQELRSTLACLVRRAQAQGPPPCPAAPVHRRSNRLRPWLPCRCGGVECSGSSAGDGADVRLFKAVEAGDLAAAQAAVADGASVRAQSVDGEEPLHLACDRGHLDIAQWLHSVGAALGATSYGGWAPPHLACTGGHLVIAQWLHSAGASLDATNNQGRTPLHYACSMGHLGTAVPDRPPYGRTLLAWR